MTDTLLTKTIASTATLKIANINSLDLFYTPIEERFERITRIADRGHGEVVDELRAILASIRSGRAEAEAFRHAATTTAEPHAARTYRLFALAAEQGADLGSALRALSDDLRDVRRDELRREATRRRAAMLIPTIAVLAPIMLLFVIAPLPSIVLGGR